MGWPIPKSLTEFCQEVLPLLHAKTDGARVKNTVADIVDSDRWNSFDRFHDTTKTLANYYEEAGAAVEITSLNTGGPVGSGRWVIHEATDVHAATLDVIDPVEERLLDYSENPWHIIQWSGATAEGGMKSELLIIDSMEELANVPCGSFSGKTILTCLDPRPYVQLLASTGAAGVITDFPVPNLPDATAWTKFGWGGIPISHAAIHLVGLVLSQTQGEKLRTIAKHHGRVILDTKVDIRRYAGTHDVVSGIIRGTDETQPELWVLSHDNEPGALDNASGVASCIEIASVLEGLISQGALPRPRCSIRMLHAYECYGFFKYLEDVKRPQIPLAGVVIDTVGSKLEICNRRLEWHATLPMSAGFVDRVGEAIIREALVLSEPGYELFLEPFMATSDTLIGDPQYGFPTPWFSTHHKDKNVASDAYHSSGDILDLISLEGIAACTTAMAGYLYFLANASNPEIIQLGTSETKYYLGELQENFGNLSIVETNYLRDCHHETIRQLKRWMPDSGQEEVLRHLDACARQINAVVANKVVGETRAESQSLPGATLVPRRTMLLTPDLFSNVYADVKSQIEITKIQPWALFWANGSRRLDEIADILSCEYGHAVGVQQVVAFFKAHAKIGYVEFIEQNEYSDKS